MKLRDVTPGFYLYNDQVIQVCDFVRTYMDDAWWVSHGWVPGLPKVDIVWMGHDVEEHVTTDNADDEVIPVTLAKTSVYEHQRQLLCEVSHSPVEWDGPTANYVTVQVDRDLWEELRREYL